MVERLVVIACEEESVSCAYFTCIFVGARTEFAIHDTGPSHRPAATNLRSSITFIFPYTMVDSSADNVTTPHSINRLASQVRTRGRRRLSRNPLRRSTNLHIYLLRQPCRDPSTSHTGSRRCRIPDPTALQMGTIRLRAKARVPKLFRQHMLYIGVPASCCRKSEPRNGRRWFVQQC
jgi:hypothetical protein